MMLVSQEITYRISAILPEETYRMVESAEKIKKYYEDLGYFISVDATYCTVTLNIHKFLTELGGECNAMPDETN